MDLIATSVQHRNSYSSAIQTHQFSGPPHHLIDVAVTLRRFDAKSYLVHLPPPVVFSQAAQTSLGVRQTRCIVTYLIGSQDLMQ